MNRLLVSSFLAFCMLIANAAFAESVRMTRVQTFAGKKHFGPVVVESDAAIQMFDIATARLVKLDKADLKVRVDNIDELISELYVPFPSYAAWKLGQMTKSGRLEALVVHNSEKGVFFNTGASDGVQAGQRCVLLTEPETIIDPVTEEVLGVIRERVGVAIPLLVRGDRLSQIDFEAVSKIANITEKQIRDAFTVGRSVEIERPVRRIAIAPPTWTTTKDAESLEDEANFLHSHLIAEMVRHGIKVISKQQIDFIQKSIAEDQKKDVANVTDIEIAKKANADVMVSGGMLAKGTKIETLLEITNLISNEYAGAILGTSRLKADRKDAARAIAFAKGLEIGRVTGIRLNSENGFIFSKVERVQQDKQGEIEKVYWANPYDESYTASHAKFLSNFKRQFSLCLSGPKIGDNEISLLADLNEIWHLELLGTSITENGLSLLRTNHPKLSHINLCGTKIFTKRGMEEISQFPRLIQIHACHVNVDNSAMVALNSSASIQKIIFHGSRLDDSGIQQLHDNQLLKHLDIRKTKVSPEGVAALRLALPGCEILADF